MKKFLSLILSLSLMLSIAMPAFAKEDLLISGNPDLLISPSPNTSEYEDVAQKLVDLNILTGYPDGKLYLDRQITRAEFVAMLIRALGYEQFIGTAKTTFEDVPDGYWAKDYIAIAHSLGYVNGVGDNRFAPEKNITLVEAEAVLLRIMNYEFETSQLGWPNGYIYTAARIGLSDKLYSHGLNATRGEIAQLIDNALTIPFYKFGSGKSDENILTTYLKYDSFNGTVTDTYLTNDVLDVNEIKIGNKKYVIENHPNAAMLIGETISGYADSKNVIRYMNEDESITIFKTIISDLSSSGLKINGETYKYDSEPTIIVNGAKVETKNLKDGMFAKIILNDNGKINYVYAFSFSKSNLKITDINDRAIKVESYSTGTTSQYLKSGKHIVYIGNDVSGNEEMLKKDMIVSVYVSGDDIVFVENSNGTISGKLNSLSSSGAKIDSKTISLANVVTYSTNGNVSIKTATRLSDLSVLLGLDVTAVLDMDGNINHIYAQNVDSNYSVGIVVSKYYTDKQYVQIFNVNNGELETYYYTSKTNRNNSKPASYNDLVSFRGDNGFSFVEINHSEEAITSITKLNYVASANVSSVRSSYIKTDNDTYYVTDDTIVVRADNTSVRYLSVVDWNKISSADVLKNVKAIIVPGEASVKAQYIIITEGYDFIGNDIVYGVVTGSEVNLNGDFLYVDTIYGEEKINVEEVDISDFHDGDVISYRININDKAVEVKKPALISAKVEKIIDDEYVKFENDDNFYEMNSNTIVVFSSENGTYVDDKTNIYYMEVGNNVKYIADKNNFLVYIAIFE